MSIATTFHPTQTLALPVAQLVNAGQLNNNTAYVGIIWNPTPSINPTSSDISTNTNGFVVHASGIYELTGLVYHTGGGARHNFALKVYKNGVAVAGTSAGGYKRRASGHDEASNEITLMLEAAAGDAISLRVARISGSGLVNIVGGQSVFGIKKLS